MLLLKILTTIFSIYILVESHCAICCMPAGFKMFCHKAKYLAGMGSSVIFIWAAWFSGYAIDIQAAVTGVAFTITLFVWPRMVYRVKHYFDTWEIVL